MTKPDFYEVLTEYKDVVNEQWTMRHFKVMHEFGIPKYHELATKARQGRNPKALMAYQITMIFEEAKPANPHYVTYQKNRKALHKEF